MVLALATITIGNGFVFIFGFRVFGDNVPCVEEAGDEAENAESDVYEGVDGADADFDPYCVGQARGLVDGFGIKEGGRQRERREEEKGKGRMRRKYLR